MTLYKILERKLPVNRSTQTSIRRYPDLIREYTGPDVCGKQEP